MDIGSSHGDDVCSSIGAGESTETARSLLINWFSCSGQGVVGEKSRAARGTCSSIILLGISSCKTDSALSYSSVGQAESTDKGEISSCRDGSCCGGWSGETTLGAGRDGVVIAIDSSHSDDV